MVMRTLLFLCVFWNIRVPVADCQMEAVYEAKINMGGVKGSVMFFHGNVPGVTVMKFSIRGLRNNNLWEIRENRRLENVWTRCIDRDIGQRFLKYEGIVSPYTHGQVFTLHIKMHQLMSRSILMTDMVTGDRICGTIESTATHVTVSAQFMYNVGGKIIFRQIGNAPGTPTSMLADIFKTREFNPTAEDVRWVIVDGGNIESVYNSMAPLLCQNTLLMSAKMSHIWNLFGKHGLLRVAANRHEGKRTYVDAYLPLLGKDSVIGKVLLLTRSNGDILSCALLRRVQERKASVQIFQENVRGSIYFSQLSEYDVTKVSINLKNLGFVGGGYHIHKWPVQERQVTGNICGDPYISGHYNPYNVDTDTSPPPGRGTDNQYEVGDLSGKYGLLNGLDSFSGTFCDDNLPLIGKYSIIGRSFTIHRSADDSRWICANVLESVPVIQAVSTFIGPVIGRIVFTQQQHDAFADTQVFVELSYADGRNSPSSNHTWRVHTKQIQNPYNCHAAGFVYNPYRVEVEGTYDRECRFCNPLRCQIGDLGQKHLNKLSIKSFNGADGFQREFVTDEFLPLTGPNSIIGKSLVIYYSNSNTVPLACSNIQDPFHMTKIY